MILGKPKGRRRPPIYAATDKSLTPPRVIAGRVVRTPRPAAWTYPQTRKAPLDGHKMGRAAPKGWARRAPLFGGAGATSSYPTRSQRDRRRVSETNWLR